MNVNILYIYIHKPNTLYIYIYTYERKYIIYSICVVHSFLKKIFLRVRKENLLGCSQRRSSGVFELDLQSRDASSRSALCTSTQENLIHD